MKKKIYKEGKFYDENGRHTDSVVTEFETPYFTQKDLIERDWKPDLIEELLGESDKREKSALYGTMMKLYLIDKVLEAEKTETFRTKRRKKRK